MIKGVGVDMVEIGRVRKLIEQDQGFAERIFVLQQFSPSSSRDSTRSRTSGRR